jgi:isovaleryl-CoA dehydrogenase
MSGLDYERLVLAAGPLGLMQAALDVAVPYAATRRQFGVPIGEHQLVGAKLADMWAATASCRAFLHATARAADAAGTADRAACAAVILVCAEAATKAALDAIQVLGGNG